MKNLKVFVVDDDPDFAEGIGLSLELEGHDVTYASSGEEAVDKFSDANFDVTLMDVRMPGMNGVETLGRLLDRFFFILVINVFIMLSIHVL